MANRFFKLLLWSVVCSGAFILGEFGRRGVLKGNSSWQNILIIGLAGGFLGLVFGLMTERVKLQKGVQSQTQVDVTRAGKQYIGILWRAYFIILPLMIASAAIIIWKPFHSWLDGFLAYFILFIVLLYYVLVQRKKVSRFYQEGVGGAFAYKFAAKDFFLMVVLIVLGIGLVAVAPYYLSSRSTGEPATQQQEADETASWQTYRNEEYGFEVKYPADLFERISLNWDKTGISFSTGIPQTGIEIEVGSNPDRLPATDWVEYSPVDMAFEVRRYKYSVEAKIIDGKECAEVLTVTSSQDLPMDQWVHTLIPFDERMVRISKVEKNKSIGLEHVYQVMISTFRFTENDLETRNSYIEMVTKLILV